MSHPLLDLEAARRSGEAVATRSLAHAQRAAHRRLRRKIGIREAPAPPCDDPELAYFAPCSVTRSLHGDLPSMLIGGLASLLLQSLHPLAMTGVADHSRYKQDPLGRLERTARFVGTTTFGSKTDAARAIRSVRALHAKVNGTASDGRAYDALDPHLLRWVHVVEVRSFLSAAQRYGDQRPSAAEADAYVDEMARVALDLGATEIPRSVAALDEALESYRPELELTAGARAARNFVLRGVGRWPHEVVGYGVLVAAAQGLLPAWGRRQLHLVSVPAADALVVRPAASALCSSLRLVAARPA